MNLGTSNIEQPTSNDWGKAVEGHRSPGRFARSLALILGFCIRQADAQKFMKPEGSKFSSGQQIGIGISFGLCFGIALGAALHSVALGIGIGIAFGVAFGGASACKKR